jgi:hypothetical protein
MSILWCGGEDVSFPNGSSGISVTTTSTLFRSTYSRCAISGTGSSLNPIYSNVFPGGAVTSCWITAQLARNSSNATSRLMLGLIKQSTTNKGLWIGSSSDNSGNGVGLFKYDGTTVTLLANSTAVIWTNNAVVLARFDVQVLSFGASATVNVYVNGSLIISFSGDVTVSGVSNVDAVALGNNINVGNNFDASEIIVATDDTRSRTGLLTMAGTAGTTDDWSGTPSNVTGTTLSDVDPVSTNITAKDEQFNVTNLPSGTFSIDAIMIAARMAVSASPTATQIKMGYKNGANIGFGTGATKTPGTIYATSEQLDATDPTTSAAWVSADINALQLDFQSA